MGLKFRQFYKPEDDAASAPPAETPAPAEAPPVPEATTPPEPTPARPPTVPAPGVAVSERSLAVFGVGTEWYAVDLDTILEIMHDFEVVGVPHLPEAYAGVINLRGESVPVVDLRALLHEPGVQDSARTCLVTAVGNAKLGFLVDSDVEIVSVSDGRMHGLPACYTKDEGKFLEGVFWMGERFIGVLRLAQTLEVLTEWRFDNE